MTNRRSGALAERVAITNGETKVPLDLDAKRSETSDTTPEVSARPASQERPILSKRVGFLRYMGASVLRVEHGPLQHRVRRRAKGLAGL
jgi:hypothetical protein